MTQIVETFGRIAIPVGLTPQAQAELNTAASRGFARSTFDPRVAAARAILPQTQQYLNGFDIAIQTSWDTLIDGPGQQRILNMVSPAGGGTPESRSGFQVGQAVAWGITKNKIAGAAGVMGSPTFAAGQLITQGITNSGLSPDQKAAIMATVAANPVARQGAQVGIAQAAADQQKGIFTKILEFFGLAA